MNIFSIFFLQNCSKIHSRTHQIAPFKKKSRGSIPPNPLAYKWLRHALHGTKRYANRLTFHKLTRTPPTPPPK